MSEQELWNELGNLYFLTGSFDPAIHAYSRAIQLDEKFGRPYSNLALTYAQLGKYPQAIRLYQFSIDRLADAKEKAATWNRLGTVHRLLKDYKNALIAFQQADELDPESIEQREAPKGGRETPLNFSTLPFLLDSVAAQEGLLEIEQDASGPDSELSPATAGASPTALTSGLLLNASDENSGEEQAEQIWLVDWDTSAAMNLPSEEEAPSLSMAESNIEKSAWTAEFPDEAPAQPQAVEATADDAPTQLEVAEIETAGEMIEVDSQTSEELSLQPSLENSMSIMVMPIHDDENLIDSDSEAVLILSEVVDSVAAGFNDTVEEQDGLQSKLVDDFIVESFAVDEAQANEIFAELYALAKGNDEQPVLDVLALSEASAGDSLDETGARHEVQINEALVLADSLEEQAADESDANSNPANQIEAEKSVTAESSGEVDPSTEWASGDSEELDFQIRRFTKKVKASPHNAFAWDMLGNLHRLAGNYDDAETAYHQAISNQPKNPEFHYHLGLVYAAQQRHDEAVNVLRETLEVDSTYYHAHATLGGYYRKLGLEEFARHHINKAIKLGFQNDSEYNRACLEAICGRTEQALMLLETALQNHQSNSHWAKHDPDLEFIRSDPRFQDLISTYAS